MADARRFDHARVVRTTLLARNAGCFRYPSAWLLCWWWVGHSGVVSKHVEAAYDSIAEIYAAEFIDELDSDTQSTTLLRQFADLASHGNGLVADFGCGPGSAVHYLSNLGLPTFGIDISSGQINQGRRAFPRLTFGRGDLNALGLADGSLGGIVSRHSIIHLDPSTLDHVFAEWRRVLQNNAPLFLSFFGSRSADAHGSAFDHKVTIAHELYPATIGQMLRDADFTGIDLEAVPMPRGGRPYDHTTILAIAD